MTFEDFFNKKRIDLNLLREADPALYSEFKSHFELMGEKSFDHTKKFWFNKLRHLYHLAEPVKKAVTQVETQIASQAEPLSSPTMEQHAPPVQAAADQTLKSPVPAKPGFRPRNVPAAPAAEAAQPAKAETDGPAEKPVVSKPGFKPRNVKPVAGESAEDAKTTASRPGEDIPSGASQGNTPSIPKTSYKPRFNAGKVAGKSEEPPTGELTPAEEKSPAAEADSAKPLDPTAAEPAKPAYKPRFNAGKLTGKKEEPAAQELTPAEDKSPAAEASSAKPLDPAAAEPAKPAYKPRFNLKNLPAKDKPREEEEQDNSNPATVSKATASPAEDTSAALPQAIQEAGAEENNTGIAAEAQSPKPAYKPRFNIKTVTQKQVTEPENQAEEQAEKAPEETTALSDTPKPKPAFKPRIGAKPSVPKPEDETPAEASVNEVQEPDSSTEAAPSKEENVAEASPKPAYKPRFNMKNIKPKE